MSKNNKVTKRLWKLFKCYYFECHAIILSNDPSNWFLPNFRVMGGTGICGETLNWGGPWSGLVEQRPFKAQDDGQRWTLQSAEPRLCRTCPQASRPSNTIITSFDHDTDGISASEACWMDPKKQSWISSWELFTMKVFESSENSIRGLLSEYSCPEIPI